MRSPIVLICLLLSTATASADPLYRLTLTGSFIFDSVEIEAFIDEFTVERITEYDGAEVIRSRWHVSEWSITHAEGIFSVLPPFDPGALASGSGHSSVYVDHCCSRNRASFTLGYNDGINFVSISLFGDTGPPDPTYGVIALPLDADVYLSTPATGLLQQFGHLQVAEIAPVPEPATLLLVTTGVVGMLARRRLGAPQHPNE